MTNVIPPFAYGHDGALLVSSDGPELLVCAGPDEGPMWLRTAKATIVGVGTTEKAVVTVDEKGTLLACERDTGEVIRELDLGIEPHSLCSSRAGVVAVVGPGAVVLVAADGATSRLEIAGAAAAALDPEGKRIGVGTEQGEFHVFDVATAKPLGMGRSSSPFKGVSWNVCGFFIATTGEGVVKVTADGGKIEHLINTDDLSLSSVSCSEDGSLCALRVGTTKACVFDLLDYQFQGVAQYERTVGQVDFGPGGWLGIGLDLGDGNKIDVLSNAVCRTDPHPGRKRNSWVLLADFKTEQIQRVMDRVLHGTPVAAGPRPKGTSANATPPMAPASSGSSMIFAVLGLVLAALVLLLLLLK